MINQLAQLLGELPRLLKASTRERFDWVTPFAMICLSAIGLFFIYSAKLSEYPAPAPDATYSQLLVGLLRTEWFKQLLYMILGAGIYLATALIDYRIWLSISHWFYLLCLVFLVLVLVPHIGTEKFGARRWIDLGVTQFQPSDFTKISVLLMTASILVRSRVGKIAQSLGVLGKLALAVGLPMFLILLQPDLKSMIVLPPMVFSMLYVSKLSTRFFAVALGAFLLIVGIVAWDCVRYVNFMHANDYSFVADKKRYEPHSWLPLHDYQRNRIISFAAPEEIDPTGVSWNVNQSLISVGSGGLTGKGWTQGTQAQLGYLPPAVSHNDFIFSVIAEEKGFLGSLTVLALFGVVLFNGIRIAGSARDRFGTLIALGVTMLFAVHVFVNIAMTIGLMPITGIPLPFISHGGTFVLSCCMLQGLVQSVYRFRKDFS